MAALGNMLAVGTLAFGTMMTGAWNGGNTDWQHQNNSYGNDKGQHDRHDGKMANKDNRFYKMSDDERNKLCNDDNYWRDWGWYYNNDRDKCCQGYSASYNKDEHLTAMYSAKQSEHEKQASSVEYASNSYDDYGRSKSNDWGNKGNSDYGYNSDQTNYKAEQSSEKSAEASVAAVVDQRTVVNNYVNVYGDNNTVNNSVSVANTAAVEQKASASEVNTASVEYNNSSNNGYGSQGWGDNQYGNSANNVSYKASEMSEKSSSSDVKYATTYNLNESYNQSQDGDHGYGQNDWGQQDNWNKKNQDDSYGHKQKDDNCDPCQYKQDDCEDDCHSDCGQQQHDDCYNN
jgi:hypothetical protein